MSVDPPKHCLGDSTDPVARLSRDSVSGMSLYDIRRSGISWTPFFRLVHIRVNAIWLGRLSCGQEDKIHSRSVRTSINLSEITPEAEVKSPHGQETILS